MSFIDKELDKRFGAIFSLLYPGLEDRCLRRLRMILGRNGLDESDFEEEPLWTESDSLLITYGDMVNSGEEAPLSVLKKFADKHLKGYIDCIHILPFFPYTSDDGFSIVDYRQVNPELGIWNDVSELSHNFDLMFDLVLNHCSRSSQWYKDYQNNIQPGKQFFIEIDPEDDLSEVTRPRAHPLAAPARCLDDKDKLLWATFSHDQLDLNFENPDVLFEFIDILLFYISQGARIVRLDAIAYLWKKLGTSCIHLSETHAVVKLLRGIFDIIERRNILLTETNVPHKENISYFGDGDEAHMVYQFSLPPLLLHALHSGSSEYLSKWASSLGEIPEGCTYLNFTASHDGVGVRPLEGIVPPEEINSLVEKVRERGGFVNVKKNTDGSESPYELNITYFDALCGVGGEPKDKDINRFLCSQAIALALQGVPAIYFHSLTATRNATDLVKELGYNRAINRSRWDYTELNKLIDDLDSTTGKVFDRYQRLLRVRRKQSAFSPDAAQEILSLGKSVFAFVRTSTDGAQKICVLNNMTDKKVDLKIEKIPAEFKGCEDLLEDGFFAEKKVTLAPYQTRWLAVDSSVS